MSQHKKYFSKEDLKKFDYFIQDTLDKYITVDAWEELYKNTGNDHKDIISDKSTIPDLVIYNKGFNKLDCFYYFNKKGKKVKFPRQLFVLRPKKVKEYDPSKQYIIQESKNKEEEKPFEFKSIPESIENKYVSENSKICDELNEFFKTGNDNGIKVKVIKENEKNDVNNNEKDNSKNKFNYPKFVNINDYYQKMVQNMLFNNYVNKKKGINKENKNNINFPSILNSNFQTNSFLNISNNNSETNITSNTLDFYSNIDGDEQIDANNYVKNMENFMRKNMTERIWIVVDEKRNIVHSYNNEELYYLLNIVIKKEEQNNYSIYSSKNPDIFISPIELFENLKHIFKKENQKI